MNNLLFTKIRKTVYQVAGNFDAILKRDNTHSFIICYHSIGNNGWYHDVTQEDFKKQIEFLLSKYTFISMDELIANNMSASKNSRPNIVLTFDDGYKSVLLVKDFLKEKGIQPTIFILSENQHSAREELGNKQELLNDFEIGSLIKDGWIIGSHSATHADFATLNSRSQQKEIVDSKLELEKRLNVSIKYFSYPRGKYSKEIKEVVKNAGYKAAVSMDDGVLQPTSDHFCLPRVAVNSSHDLNEIKYLNAPSVTWIRGLIKKLLGYS